MTEPKKPKEQPESPLARAMRTGTLGAVEKQPINGEKKEPVLQPVQQKEEKPAALQPESKDDTKRRRITAYVAPDIYQWTKVRAAMEDRELSELVEDALRQYRARVDRASE